MTAIGLILAASMMLYVFVTNEPRSHTVKGVMGLVFIIGIALMVIGAAIKLWEIMP